MSINTNSQTLKNIENQETHPPTLSELKLTNDLYFSLNYHHLSVKKTGLLAKFKKQRVDLDIDLACVLFDDTGEQLDLIWYKKLRDKSEAICHFGDELQGFLSPEEKQKLKNSKNKQKTDNTSDEHNNTQQPSNQHNVNREQLLSPENLELIHLKLSKLPKEVAKIELIVSSYQDVPLRKVSAGETILEDVEGNTAIYTDLNKLDKDCCSLWLATLVRLDNHETSTQYDIRNDDWQLIHRNKTLSHADIAILARRLSDNI